MNSVNENYLLDNILLTLKSQSIQNCIYALILLIRMGK